MTDAQGTTAADALGFIPSGARLEVFRVGIKVASFANDNCGVWSEKGGGYDACEGRAW